MERLYYDMGEGGHVRKRRLDVKHSQQKDEVEADARACTVCLPVIKALCENEGLSAEEGNMTVASIDIMFSVFHLLIWPICVPSHHPSLQRRCDVYVKCFPELCMPIRRRHFREHFLPTLGERSRAYAFRVSAHLEKIAEDLSVRVYPHEHPMSGLRRNVSSVAEKEDVL
jgi:hypothetical protein